MDALMKIYAQKPVLPAGTVNGAQVCYPDSDFSDTSDSENGDEDQQQYEQEFVQQEMHKYNTIQNNEDTNGFDDISEIDGGEFYRRGDAGIYENYNFNSTFVKNELPIDSFKGKILDLITCNNVVVIQGPTGCGKTTQVPQYILDDCRLNGKLCNIAVTQPRKIATIGVSRRVCQERGWTLGTVCGYQVGLEKRNSFDTILTYMTTGVLLQKLIVHKSLHEFSHIIIDEVHERNQELDFLLLIVRKFLFTNSPETKVILMSATIEANDFAYYFRRQNRAIEFLPPIIYVDKESNYTTQAFYGDDLENYATLPKFDLDKPEIHENIYKIFGMLVAALDNVDEIDPATNQPRIGSVLVFLPGINEIEEANKLLSNKKGCKGIKLDIVPLHSSLPNDEQAKVFSNQKPGHRKVILSTNIAESSITVPDSCYVIDFCLTKVMTIDPITKYCSLRLEWASHVNCDQRAGRVGRVCNGRVYRLVSKDFYLNKISSKSIPEIMRAPLERVVLQAKMLNLNETPKQILALALNPPNLKNIEATMWHLKESGGLLSTVDGVRSASDGDITFLGRVMASLPIDVHLSKLIVLGHMFSCLDDAIIIAGGCSIQNIFSIPFQQRFEAYKKKLVWADGSCSDLIALLNLYNVWNSYKRENHFANNLSEHRWCSINLVSRKGLQEWSLLITELKSRLAQLRIQDTVGPRKVKLTSTEKPTVLKIITSGAFYPNFFVKKSANGERDAVKMVGGRDPFRTIFLTGMDATQPGQLYVRAIKKLFKDNDNNHDFQIGFDGSSKIYVEFNAIDDATTVNYDGQQIYTKIPGKIPRMVYECVRKRQLKLPLQINLLPMNEAWEWAEKHGIKKNMEQMALAEAQEERNCYSSVDYSPIPSLDTEYISITITHKIDAGHFWCQNVTPETTDLISKIENCLNRLVLQPVNKSQLNSPHCRSLFYAAKFYEDNRFYRCKILSLKQDTAMIIFIDYGNIQQIKTTHLFQLPSRPECFTAPLAIECVLCEVKPALRMNPHGLWCDEVNELFSRQTANVLLHGKVYSVVGDVVHLELYKSQPSRGNNQLKSLNRWLIERGYAEKAEESFLSKEDHLKRQAVLAADNPNSEASKLAMEKIVNYADFESPNLGSNYSTIQLKGPYSPLEMKIHGVTDSSSNSAADIEGTSVNTVLLDTEPEDQHGRLIVAGYVGQSANGGRLTLRQTTLMPNIPGFPMLMSLLFAPIMEPKVVEGCARVASILCGLGYNPITDKPYYPTHDMNIVLDTDLRVSEIEQINKIRYLMNNLIRLMDNISGNLATVDEFVETQVTLKNLLFDLICLPRKSVEPINLHYATQWNKNPPCTFLRPDSQDDSKELWPLHGFVILHDDEKMSRIGKNLDDLDQMCRKMIPFETTKCELCDVQLFTVYEVREHLISHLHEKNFETYQAKVCVESDYEN